VVEGDITACFDEIAHPSLTDRLRKRIGDKRVLALVKAFLKAGILGQDGPLRDSNTGGPQGGILSPCWPTWPCRCWTRTSPRSPAGQAAPKASGPPGDASLGNYRLVRYADDWLLMTSGTREHAEQMRERAAAVLGGCPGGRRT